MNMAAVNKFKSICDFPELVEYLRDELDWPIETDDFEEMTFEYSAEELGLDARTAPKFLEIHRLRPLDKNQPWGIFFIRFEESKLPVVALRRLLSKLALKKRSTSNASDRASWHENDLLLISQTGGTEEKRISFAHFASNPEKTDLPILKVLGWDNDDTGLKIDYVIETLREKLLWPDDPANSDAWRSQWRDAFTLKNREVIQSSKDLAEKLGKLALAVRTRLRELLAIESDQGTIHTLMSVFKDNLIPDLDMKSFSDMYAQTIAYGLFYTRIINPKINTADAVHLQIATTNPFLGELLETFLTAGGRDHSHSVKLDFDELGLNEVVELLDNTNMEAVLRDFGDRNQNEDPIMHFFEGFLKEYDNKIKKERGVFYTPKSVVSFIVKSVDEKLRVDYELQDGLADISTWKDVLRHNPELEKPNFVSWNDPFVQILDPATGTGTFLVAVIDLIHETMVKKWCSKDYSEEKIKENWNGYVPSHLLTRLHGFELLMGPYTIAHAKIGLKLLETGYEFANDCPLKVLLTNALTPPEEDKFTLGSSNFLFQEVSRVQEIKTSKAFTAIIGNPPYSVSSKNKNSYIDCLMKLYKKGVKSEKNIQPLSDDYIKFIRLIHNFICKSGTGIVGIVSNNAYLSGIIFRGVRQELARSFSSIKILDLNGNQINSKVLNDGTRDQNVFDIQQGVSIAVLGTGLKSSGATKIKYSSLLGSREKKYQNLTNSSFGMFELEEINQTSDEYLFLPRSQERADEYNKGWAIDTIFVKNISGVKTHRDKLVFAFSQQDLLDRIEAFVNPEISDEYFISLYNLKDTKGWKISEARQRAREDDERKLKVLPCLYRPFDKRYLYYAEYMLDRSRRSLMKNMYLINKNLAIVAMRQVADGHKYNHFGVADVMIDNRLYFSNRGIANIFPLYILNDKNIIKNNFSNNFLSYFEERLNLKFCLCEKSKCVDSFQPQHIINYIQSILHCSIYHDNFSHLLPFGFPKIPIVKSKEIFWELNRIGGKIVDMQLSNFSSAEEPIATFPISGSNKIEQMKVIHNGLGDKKTKIFINKDQYFLGAFKNILEKKYGGYIVCEKWFNERIGQVLNDVSISEFDNILKSLNQIDCLSREVSLVIENHGGWDNLF
jgi:predicted helicase